MQCNQCSVAKILCSLSFATYFKSTAVINGRSVPVVNVEVQWISDSS